jgi:hypothetical protein
MEVVRTSETSVYSNEITRRYILEVSHLHTRRRQNLKSYCYLSLTVLLDQCFSQIFFSVAAIAATVGLRWQLCINHTKKAVKFKYTFKLHQYFLI